MPADEVAVMSSPPRRAAGDGGLSFPAEHGVRVAWSRDGRILATTGRDRAGPGSPERFTVRVWDLSRGTLAAVVAAHRAPISSLAFTPGEELITASLDGSMRIWNARSGALLGSLEHARARRERPNAGKARDSGWTGVLPVTGMDLSADGNTIASISGARDVVLWGVAGSQLVAVLEGREPAAAQRVSTRDALRRGHVEPVTSIAFSPDSRTLATASRADGTVRLWDVRAATARHVLRVAVSGFDGAAMASEGPTSLGWSADGATLAVGTARGTVELWDAATGTRAASFASGAASSPLASVAFRPQGGTLAAGTSDGSARLFRTHHTPSLLTEVRLASEPAAVEQVAWSTDGRMLALSGDGVLLARAHDGATIALHAFVDEGARPRWAVEAHDGRFDGDVEAPHDVEPQRRRGLLRTFVSGQ